MATPNALAAVSLFETLDDDERLELAGWFEERSFDEGALVVAEGASGYSFFVIAGGSAVAPAGDRTLRELGPGDFFGEVGIIERRRRTATVTTTSPSKLLVLFGAEFRQLQEAQPALAGRIEAAMRARLAGD